MLISGMWRDRPVNIRTSPQSLNLSIEDGQNSRVFCFDLEGKLWSAMISGKSYRHGLNGGFLLKWSEGGQKFFDRMDLSSSREVIERCAVETRSFISDFEAGKNIVFSAVLPADILRILVAAGQYSGDRFVQDIQTIRSIYKNVGILPPDQYMALVIEAVEGCPWNRCHFCSAFRRTDYRIKTQEEIDVHIRLIKEFFGKGLSIRRPIFLGSANALSAPYSDLSRIFSIVQKNLPVETMGGINVFMDGFSDFKTPNEFRCLVSMGLKRVFIGLESGSLAWLKRLGKPLDPKITTEMVHTIKSAGCSIGIILLSGLKDGPGSDDEHVIATTSVINEMKLGMDDLIFFSHFQSGAAFQPVEKIVELPIEEARAQENRMEAGFLFTETGGSPHIASYNIRESIFI